VEFSELSSTNYTLLIVREMISLSSWVQASARWDRGSVKIGGVGILPDEHTKVYMSKEIDER
jgi:hypothetical protein